MQQDYKVASGATLASAALPNGSAIRGITITNPTGNWLRIDAVPNDLCPPFTEGWSRDLPNVLQLSVTPQTRSTGGSLSPPTITTAIVNVNLSSVPVGNSNGTPISAGAATPANPRLITATGAGQTANINVVNATAIFVSTATRKIVIRRLLITYDYGIQASSQPARQGLMHQWVDQTTTLRVWVQDIAPETPMADSAFEDGALVLTTGANLMIAGGGEVPSIRQNYLWLAQYYELETVQP